MSFEGGRLSAVASWREAHPDRVRPERFQLIAPHEPNPRRWLKLPWIDRYSGKTFCITTRGHHGGAGIARVQTYGDVIESYEFHPEAKFADAQGEPCRKQTVGLLQRRHVRIGLLTNIGKESNSLEEVRLVLSTTRRTSTRGTTIRGGVIGRLQPYQPFGRRRWRRSLRLARANCRGERSLTSARDGAHPIGRIKLCSRLSCRSLTPLTDHTSTARASCR